MAECMKALAVRMPDNGIRAGPRAPNAEDNDFFSESFFSISIVPSLK